MLRRFTVHTTHKNNVNRHRVNLEFIGSRYYVPMVFRPRADCEKQQCPYSQCSYLNLLIAQEVQLRSDFFLKQLCRELGVDLV